MLWQQTWGGEYSDGFYSGSKTENDSFVLVGYLRSPQVNELVHKGAEYDGLIIKFDNNGNILWERIMVEAKEIGSIR